MARFDRVIHPGGVGSITLKVNTYGIHGNVRKTARVFSNDQSRKPELLTIKAFIKSPIYVAPRSVYLKGSEGQKITKTVMIKSEESKPLRLEPSHFNLNEKVIYKIEEVEAGRLYMVSFTNILGSAGTYKGALRLKTNYPKKPEISITIRGRFRKVDAQG